MICSKSSPESGPHHHPLSPSPGGWGDKLSAPSPSFCHHSSRFHSPRSLLFCLALILFLLMWGLSFSSSLASLGAPKLPRLCLPLFYFSSVSSSPPLYFLLMMRGLYFGGKPGSLLVLKPILNLSNCICVCVHRRLNTLNKCALMRLEISPQRKRVSAHAYTWPPLLPEKPLRTSPQPQLHFLTSTMSSLLATGHSCVFSNLV